MSEGANREQARRRRIAAVEDGVLFGIPTNRGFLLSALKHQAAANHAQGEWKKRRSARPTQKITSPLNARLAAGAEALTVLDLRLKK